MEKVFTFIKKFKVLIIFIIILGIGISFLIYFLTLPPHTPIQNYNDFSSASWPTKRHLEEFLYRFINEHHNNDNPEDVYIRKGSYSKAEDTGLTSESFLIDINSLKISYLVNYTWPNSEVADGIIINCPDYANVIFPDTKCIGMYNTSEEMALRAKYPLIEKLPLTIDEYTNNYSDYINYTITYTLNTNDSSVIITIADLSGGNYENAIKKISDLGFNPKDYNIKYEDRSVENYWPRLTKY